MHGVPRSVRRINGDSSTQATAHDTTLRAGTRENKKRSKKYEYAFSLQFARPCSIQNTNRVIRKPESLRSEFYDFLFTNLRSFLTIRHSDSNLLSEYNTRTWSSFPPSTRIRAFVFQVPRTRTDDDSTAR